MSQNSYPIFHNIGKSIVQNQFFSTVNYIHTHIYKQNKDLRVMIFQVFKLKQVYQPTCHDSFSATFLAMNEDRATFELRSMYGGHYARQRISMQVAENTIQISSHILFFLSLWAFAFSHNTENQAQGPVITFTGSSCDLQIHKPCSESLISSSDLVYYWMMSFATGRQNDTRTYISLKF